MYAIASKRIVRAARVVACTLVMMSGGAASVTAQSRTPTLSVSVPEAAGQGAVVNATNVFAQTEIRDLVRAAFPALLRYRVELWRTGGLFDDLEGQNEWEVIIQYDPSAQRYGVIRRAGTRVEEVGSFVTLATAQTVIERPVRTLLTADRAGARYYYSFTLEIEALSVTDMDQLSRWLRGVRNENPASAVGSGLRTLMLRMLGSEKRRYTTKSASFIAEK